MDTDNLRSRLQNLHIGILGRQLDNKTLNFWINAIQGKSKTVEDYESTLLRGEEYKGYILKRFRETYMDLIGFDITEEECAKFYAKFGGSLVSEHDIFSHVTSLAQFDEKYVAIINNQHLLSKKEPCNIDTLNFYMSQFKANPMYTVDALEKDIVDGRHLVSLSCKHHGGVAEGNGDATSKYVAFAKEFEKVVGTIPDNVRSWYEATTSQCKTLGNLGGAGVVKVGDYDNKILHAFEIAFKRPMYVQEYFKYVPGRVPVEEYPSLANAHSINYNKLREIYTAYTDIDMDEYTYVKTYLYEVDISGFYDTIIDRIVESDEYAECIKDVLVDKYKSMYDEDLDSNDVAYIFNIVKKQKLGHSDDKLTGVLASVKKETDIIISHIFKQFTDVLERQPDVFEIDQYVAYYRERLASSSLEIIDVQLETILMHSLEFHDIIKKKIKNIYVSTKKREIVPSIVFGLLNKILSVIDECKMSNIDELITSVLP